MTPHLSTDFDPEEAMFQIDALYEKYDDIFYNIEKIEQASISPSGRSILDDVEHYLTDVNHRELAQQKLILLLSDMASEALVKNQDGASSGRFNRLRLLPTP